MLRVGKGGGRVEGWKNGSEDGKKSRNGVREGRVKMRKGIGSVEGV